MAETRISSSLLFLLYIAMMAPHLADASPLGIFIFGDSTVDVGTNNYLNLSQKLAKADFPYNGIDFPDSLPTGRFSNGYNVADFVAKHFGFNRSPPSFLFLANDTSHLVKRISALRGVNFASGGAGIQDKTGLWMGDIITVSEQIQQFATIRSNLTEHMGQNMTDSLLSESIFLISIGSNDIFEYFYFNGSASNQEFFATVTSKYEGHLKDLFSLGARKFAIISVPAVGCCPAFSVKNKTGKCLEGLNEYAQTFYLEIGAMLGNLSSQLQGMKYSIGNSYEMMRVFMDDPLVFHFTEIYAACCGNGTRNGEGMCEPQANICWNRDQHLFWDWFHPTEKAAALAALTLYGGETRFVSPINFRALAEVQG